MDANENGQGTVGLVGGGLIGRAWAVVFARASFRVRLFDADPAAARAAVGWMAEAFRDLAAAELLAEPPETVAGRVAIADTLAEAAAGAAYVQESAAESPEVKRALFAALDAAAPPAAIRASSTSTIPASAFTQELAGRRRCLVAHPVNPPHLVPLVELAPAPWTDGSVVARARALLAGAGQAPIVVRREIEGFVLNRLQGALLHESFRLVEDGYATPEDVDLAVSEGLGLRWSFMGPFETIDLNAPGGLADYARRYGPLFHRMALAHSPPRPWSAELTRAVEAARRKALPASALAERQGWRDRRLMALARHKRLRERDDER
jgi:3-hydroxyacyl-CoA dehydrogenase